MHARPAKAGPLPAESRRSTCSRKFDRQRRRRQWPHRQLSRREERRHLLRLTRAAGRAKGELGRGTSTCTATGRCATSATMKPSTRVARMQVTPDGRHMALVTGSNLTDYDSGGHLEMYLYEPESGPDHLRLLPARRPAARQRRAGAVRTASSSPTTAASSSPPRTHWCRETPTRPKTSTSSRKARPQLITTGIGPGLDGTSAAQAPTPGLVERQRQRHRCLLRDHRHARHAGSQRRPDQDLRRPHRRRLPGRTRRTEVRGSGRVPRPRQQPAAAARRPHQRRPSARRARRRRTRPRSTRRSA